MKRYMILVRAAPRLLRFALSRNKPAFEAEIFQAFMEMGGIYVKFLQALTQEADFFQHLDFRRQLESLNEAPASPIDLRAHLAVHLGSRRRHFKRIEERPFATGSFANVYRGQLQDGQIVILKILRPKLRRQLFIDRRLVMLVSRIWDLFLKLNGQSIVQIAKDFTKAMSRETDYLSEARNAQSLREAYAGNDQIHIPKTYPELSSRYLLVQEHLNGLLVKDVLAHRLDHAASRQYVAEQLNSNIEYQMEHLGYDLLTRIFVGLPVHGDLHAGNVMLMRDNKIGLIDFGQLGMPMKDRLGFYEYIREQTYIHRGNLRAGKFGMTIFRVNSGSLYRAIAKMDEYSRGPAGLMASFESFLDKTFNDSPIAQQTRQKMIHGYTSDLFNKVVNGGNRFSTSFEIDGLTVRRSARLFCQLAGSFGLYESSVHRAYEKAVVAVSGEFLVDESQRPGSFEEAMETLAEWLENIREKDQLLYQQLKNIVGDFRQGSATTSTL